MKRYWKSQTFLIHMRIKVFIILFRSWNLPLQCFFSIIFLRKGTFSVFPYSYSLNIKITVIFNYYYNETISSFNFRHQMEPGEIMSLSRYLKSLKNCLLVLKNPNSLSGPKQGVSLWLFCPWHSFNVTFKKHFFHFQRKDRAMVKICSKQYIYWRLFSIC